MSLTVHASPAEALNTLLFRPPFRETAVLVARLRASDWVSLGLGGRNVWGDEQLENLAFWLQGGSFKATGTRVPEDGSEDLYEGVKELYPTECVELVRGFYLGPLWSGCVPNLSASTLARRVRRVAAACPTDCLEESRRLEVGRCLDGYVIFGAAPDELRPLSNALGALGLKTAGGDSFRAQKPEVAKARLGAFFDECNPISSLNGFLCQDFSSDAEAVAVFGREWSGDDAAALSNDAASTLAAKLGLSPSSARGATRCLAACLKAAAAERQMRVAEAPRLPATPPTPNRPPHLSLTSSRPTAGGAAGPSSAGHVAATAMAVPAVDPVFQRADPEAVAVAAAAEPERRASRKAKPAPALSERKELEAALASVLSRFGGMNGIETGGDETDSEDEDGSETSEEPRHPVESLLSPKTTKGPSGMRLTAEAQREMMQLPKEVRPEFIRF